MSATRRRRFRLRLRDGETIALAHLRGRVVYVDFWASWCAPCRRSFPWMNEMQQRYADRGLTIVAINVDRRRADADQFLQINTARFAVVYDGGARRHWRTRLKECRVPI